MYPSLTGRRVRTIDPIKAVLSARDNPLDHDALVSFFFAIVATLGF